ncbi:hypothetical protein JFU37_02575 [Pseudomonas sp. TH41]|uniref:hypothetical protein n=1 Tax=Pseudomonas sp. TH41 TaxID=2796405 RepID=UPI00191147AC|nr:hypothetical protein [Pseudomonas sp. TH41]MBK5351413.1 hypothetical protein [Pseudomonas sp. TH41]
MKSTLTLMLLLALVNVAYADSTPGMPSFDVDCPGKIPVHADQDGPVLINGKEAESKAIDDHHFEAKGQGLTLSIFLDADDSVIVTPIGKTPNNPCLSVDD